MATSPDQPVERTYRDLAEQALAQAGQTLNQANGQTLPAELIIAGAQRAQAMATVALAQAVIHLADTLGSAPSRPTS